MKNYLLLIICIAAFACNKEENKEQIYESVIPGVLDSIYLYVGYPKGKDILINPYDDYLDSLTIHRVLQSLDSQKSEDFKLIQDLSYRLNEKPTIKFDELQNVKYYKLISDKSVLEKYDYDNSPLIGSSTISDIVFNHNEQNALFYIDLQCGGSCGSGYLVFVKRNNDQWSLDRLIHIWGEKKI